MGQYLTRLGKKPHQAAEKGSSEGPQLSIESFSALARPQMWFFRPLPQIHPALGYRNQLTKTLDGHNSAKLDCREDILASRLPAWQAPSAGKSIFFIYSLPPGFTFDQLLSSLSQQSDGGFFPSWLGIAPYCGSGISDFSDFWEHHTG